jgi:hypothetical protein
MFNEISIDVLANVTGGADWGNAMRAGAVAGMGLVTGEEGPKFPTIEPMGQSTTAPGSAGRAPFEPMPLPGGGIATFGK